jgi:NAD-dependent DNA ligase
LKDNGKKMFKAYQKKKIHYLKTLSTKELEEMLTKADDAYFNTGTPLLTDDEYDALLDYVTKHHPSLKTRVGAPPPSCITASRKVTLPHPLHSLDKVKTVDDIKKWTGRYKGPYLLSPKLDGVSALLCVHGNTKSLYTRGDGEMGLDLSWLVPHLRNLSAIPTCDTVVRGELLLKKSVFAEYFPQEKGNARNTVSGLVNRQEASTFHQYLEFKAYEVIVPHALTPEQQMKHLVQLCIPCVFTVLAPVLDVEYLHDMVVTLRKEYPYEIDGVVCVDNHAYDRVTHDNPPYAVAFKTQLSDQVAKTTVVDVVWKANKDGYLKPRAKVIPVTIGGNRIEYVTAFHAGYVVQHGIGRGAIVEIVRSGDVIPQISCVKSPAEPTMPPTSYRWNETKVDVMVADTENNPEVQLQKNVRFFKELGVAGVGAGQLKKLFEHGYKTPQAIVAMSVSDFVEVPGFQQTSATKLHENIRQCLKNASLVDLLSASNVFGRGVAKKSLQLLTDSVPNLLEATHDDLSNIKGVGPKTVDCFLEKRDEAKSFLASLRG